MKKPLLSILVSAAMVLAPLPAMSANTGPLAPGKAAGVKQAQGITDPPFIWLIGAGVVIALGILVLANDNDDDGTTPPPTTTTTTGTSS